MKSIFLFVSLLTGTLLNGQQTYWQQQLRYDISVELNDKENSMKGFEKIVYKNNSPSSLDFIWFHIWPNAYKSKSTAMFQQISKDKSRSKKLESSGAGFIDGIEFKVNDKLAKTEAHPNPQYIDIIKLVLDKPLLSGDSIIITTPFMVKLPPYFSRSGYADGEFMICQWYPKPAVFDKSGWHEFPYLDMGEFYGEYGNYTVNITIPSEYVVGATGVLQTKDELALYKQAGMKNVEDRSGKRHLYVPVNKGGNKTLTYYADSVIDFAWFADKNFAIQYDTVKLPTGKIVDAFTYYHNKKGTLWNNSIDYVKDAVKKYSAWVGEYGYPVVQAVEGPGNNTSGGMEYPMITLITSPDAKAETLDAVIAHEVGHNWFMAMLGSNERLHAWMDEGLNSYFQFRYEAEKYRSNSIFGGEIPKELKAIPMESFQKEIYRAMGTAIPMKYAMATPSDKFPDNNEYATASYLKPAIWLYLFEASLGWESVELAFHNYFNKWKFKHPQPEDMQAAFEEALDRSLTQFFEWTKKEGMFE